MRKRKAAPQDKNQDALLGEIQRLRQQVHQLQLERDILTKANELIKKDLGISFLTLKNREKTWTEREQGRIWCTCPLHVEEP